jgi:hypothetical protein
MRLELNIRAERVRTVSIKTPGDDRGKAESSFYLLERVNIINCYTLGKGISEVWLTWEDFEKLRLAAALLPEDYGGGRTGYFHRNCFQKTNLFYKLTGHITLPENPYPFNPFSASPMQNRGEYVSPVFRAVGPESGLRHTESHFNGFPTDKQSMTQVLPISDSGIRYMESGINGREGENNRGNSIPLVLTEEITNLEPHPRELYNLLRKVHHHLKDYQGAGMSQPKALELAARFGLNDMLYQQACLIVNRLTTDWNSEKSNISHQLEC